MNIKQKILLFVRGIAHLMLFSFDRQIGIGFLFIECLFYFIFLHNITNTQKKYKFIQNAIIGILGAPIIIGLFFIISNRVSGLIDDYKNAQTQKEIEMRIKKENEPIVFSYDNVTLQYPKKLSIEKGEYKTFNFFDSSNIYINKSSWEDLFTGCVAGWQNQMTMEYPSDRGPYTSGEIAKRGEDAWVKYNNLFDDIQNGRKISEENVNMLDHISCLNTMGIISSRYIDIGGYKALLSHYYITQDDALGCLSQYVTNLLIPISKKEVYNITFQNNFGDTLKYLKQYSNGYGEACLYDKESVETAQFYSKKLFDYYTKRIETISGNLESFGENQIIFQKIIDSIKIK